MCFLSVLGGGEVGGAKTYESVKKCILQTPALVPV